MIVLQERLRSEPGQGSNALLRLAYCVITVIVSGQETLSTRKRRGPAPTGKGTPIGVRLQPNDLSALDEWIARQEIPLSRPEAIRVILRQALP
jgi:hypothetical protein